MHEDCEIDLNVGSDLQQSGRRPVAINSMKALLATASLLGLSLGVVTEATADDASGTAVINGGRARSSISNQIKWNPVSNASTPSAEQTKVFSSNHLKTGASMQLNQPGSQSKATSAPSGALSVGGTKNEIKPQAVPPVPAKAVVP